MIFIMKTITAITIGMIFATAAFSANSDTLNANSKWSIDESHEDIHCLAQNIYFEARSDMAAGQFAVADVVLNRVRDTRWPNKICEVVKQGPISQWHLENSGKEVPIRHRCQFSWYCDGKSDEAADPESWERSLTIAYQIITNETYRGITSGSTHYHATYVSPSWSLAFQRVGQIGKHIFYRSE